MRRMILFLFVVFIANSYSQNIGDSAYIKVNRIYLPFDNRGIIATVYILPYGQGGYFDSSYFLYASGFWLSGYTNNSLWANGVAADFLLKDYQAGTVSMDPNDPKASIYKLSENDIPFGQSWQDWIDAVDLGADFYDGDGDGIYNPVDKNSNGIWDPDEDKPDLLLDETYWCVYNDGVAAGQRRWGSDPQGIEMRQTIFAASSVGALENVVFIRYRIKNTGLLADTLKDVYFSFYADGDVGNPFDDTYGCDTIRQAIYFYNSIPDPEIGNEVPSFMMDMLAGPYSYIPGITFIDNNGNNIYENGIDIPLDTAVSHRGPLGIVIYPGAENLSMTYASFQISAESELDIPDDIYEARNYVFGLNRLGEIIDPCNWYWGEVRGGVPCNEVNPYFWLSGDPVTDVGWIGTFNIDVRGPGNTGPFVLVKNEEVEILVGYEIDRDSTPIGGVTTVRNISDIVQSFYDNNFGYPIVPVEDDKITLITGFKLEQNYPNPFNPTTHIGFRIANYGFVSLKIYDVLGNEIANVLNEEKASGEYEIVFNATGLPSGIYFYQLKCSNFIETKKMILLK